jgi:predicted PurR-regulated permease PerM
VGTIASVSLAVMAAAAVAAVLLAVPVLVQIRRTAARAESVLAYVEGTLPGLVAELRQAAARSERALEAVERVDRLAAAAARTLQFTGAAMRRLAADVVAPSAANAAGLLAGLRAGIQWVWLRRHRRGGMHERAP